jgi:hypothetical protein
MDELYNDDLLCDCNKTTTKIDLTPEPLPANSVDPFFELAQLKKKHGSSRLNKTLNEKFNDNFMRTTRLKNKLKEKLQKKNMSTNNKEE